MDIIEGGIYTGMLQSRTTSSAYTSIYSAVGYTTFQIPTDAYGAYVECWGGGAGGEGQADAGSNTYGGDGGGGGGYAAKFISVIPGAYYSYQVGSGGTAGINPTPYPGSGGTTFFGVSGCTLTTATVRAGGGGALAPGSVQTNAGGLAVTNIGDVTYYGGYGQAGSRTSSPYKTGGGGGGAGSQGGGYNGSLGDGNGGTAAGGAGGSEFGGGGGNGYPLSNPTFPPNRDYGNGSNATKYGGGGGGAGGYHTDGGIDIVGGSGAQGLIRITYYI